MHQILCELDVIGGSRPANFDAARCPAPGRLGLQSSSPIPAPTVDRIATYRIMLPGAQGGATAAINNQRQSSSGQRRRVSGVAEPSLKALER